MLAGRHEQALIAVAALSLTTIPLLTGDKPRDVGEWIGAIGTVIGALGLTLWRRHPVAASIAGPAFVLVCAATGPEPSNFLLPVLVAYAALAAEHFSGRAAWAAGLAWATAVVCLYAITGQWDSPGLLILIAPGFLAGTALRLRRETAEQLAQRGRELEAERDLFAEVSVDNERARIASELHDIVGHALTVMVVQAAAGQRLALRSPEAAARTFQVIAESAHQGRADLQRLIELLTGTEVAGPDLLLVDELVDQAARSGLQVTCRLEGSREGLGNAAAHAVFRVVQESLTNALRHAPGAAVNVLIRTGAAGGALTVRVENEPAPHRSSPVSGTASGTGRGLIGLRERVLDLGGTFTAGPASTGGWAVEAHLAAEA